MPGLSDTAARVLIAEIGDDMSRFPSPGHLISWAGLCPRLDISAGKRHSTRIATPWLKTTLIQATWAAARKKDSYLDAQFLRLKASMLTAAYFMLRDGVEYHDLGGRF
jgi:transposase